MPDQFDHHFMFSVCFLSPQNEGMTWQRRSRSCANSTWPDVASPARNPIGELSYTHKYTQIYTYVIQLYMHVTMYIYLYVY